ncbi:hypothetical protein BZA05DRAFT_421587 [Tricharina praecox]|uniref:uncharacterized protein n=1 Tax=Tricharina praecox TaxID=43433 RepID=UPI00221ECE4A|nr:uncharacterized protein BZA05DRAFT_421587 [Tricharina praecox]KAI5844912.1 hypothetical protein BZA05DRAFT_421587 [Tricharina praecox]
MLLLKRWNSLSCHTNNYKHTASWGWTTGMEGSINLGCGALFGYSGHPRWVAKGGTLVISVPLPTKGYATHIQVSFVARHRGTWIDSKLCKSMLGEVLWRCTIRKKHQDAVGKIHGGYVRTDDGNLAAMMEFQISWTYIANNITGICTDLLGTTVSRAGLLTFLPAGGSTATLATATVMFVVTVMLFPVAGLSAFGSALIPVTKRSVVVVVVVELEVVVLRLVDGQDSGHPIMLWLCGVGTCNSDAVQTFTGQWPQATRSLRATIADKQPKRHNRMYSIRTIPYTSWGRQYHEPNIRKLATGQWAA